MEKYVKITEERYKELVAYENNFIAVKGAGIDIEGIKLTDADDVIVSDEIKVEDAGENNKVNKYYVVCIEDDGFDPVYDEKGEFVTTIYRYDGDELENVIDTEESYIYDNLSFDDIMKEIGEEYEEDHCGDYPNQKSLDKYMKEKYGK